MMEQFKTILPEKGVGLKNLSRVLTEGKSENAPASKVSFNFLLWIWANIVAALISKLLSFRYM